MAFRSQTAAPASGRLAQSLPLLLFLIILGVGSYMGREQIEVKHVVADLNNSILNDRWDVVHPD